MKSVCYPDRNKEEGLKFDDRHSPYVDLSKVAEALSQYEKNKKRKSEEGCYICGRPAGEGHELFCSRGK